MFSLYMWTWLVLWGTFANDDPALLVFITGSRARAGAGARASAWARASAAALLEFSVTLLMAEKHFADEKTYTLNKTDASTQKIRRFGPLGPLSSV